jgi:hypothetical protein
MSSAGLVQRFTDRTVGLLAPGMVTVLLKDQ